MTTLGLTGLWTAIIAFWGQAQSLLFKFYSLFIVTTDLEQAAAGAFLFHCWKNFKPSPLSRRRLTGWEGFIKPLGRMGYFATETIGGSVIFFKKFLPISVSTAAHQGGGGYADQMVTVSYIRGTLNLDKIITEELKDISGRLADKKKEGPRYWVSKKFGKLNRPPTYGNGKERDTVSNQASPSAASIDPIYKMRSRILGWDEKDIGQPDSKNPLQALAYPKDVLDFLEHLQRWKSLRGWYKEKGISWRHGALLGGKPGTGKTSFVRAAAQVLNLPVIIMDLPSMTNEELTNHWNDALFHGPCIVLFEDIDRIFDKDKNIKTAEKGGVTLDCLLNLISGVDNSDGILTIVTANDISKLDAALGVPDTSGKSTRPGRLDKYVEFREMDETCRRKLASHILSDFPHLIEETVRAGLDETGAQFQKRCSDLAVKELWGSNGVSTRESQSLEENQRQNIHAMPLRSPESGLEF